MLSQISTWLIQTCAWGCSGHDTVAGRKCGPGLSAPMCPTCPSYPTPGPAQALWLPSARDSERCVSWLSTTKCHRWAAQIASDHCLHLLQNHPLRKTIGPPIGLNNLTRHPIPTDDEGACNMPDVLKLPPFQIPRRQGQPRMFALQLYSGRPSVQHHSLPRLDQGGSFWYRCADVSTWRHGLVPGGCHQ